jgi:hypothetical protein
VNSSPGRSPVDDLSSSTPYPVLADSVTAVPSGTAGRLLITGSHGGRYSAACALALGVAAAVFSDAGRGKDDAGIAGLGLLDEHDIPGAAVSHLSARIGDARDVFARGRISALNRAAKRCGVREGDMLLEAWQLLPAHADVRIATTTSTTKAATPKPMEARHVVRDGTSPRVHAIDSNSLVVAEDRRGIVVTGSHGGLLGGREETAIKQAVFAAFYNDAGVGIDEAGVSRLPALDKRSIAGIAVDAFSARIGDGLSTYREGIATHVNRTAAAFGASPGMRVADIVELLCAAWLPTPQDPEPNP